MQQLPNISPASKDCTFFKYCKSWVNSLSLPYSRMLVPARAGLIVVSPHRSSIVPFPVRKSTRGIHIRVGVSRLKIRATFERLVPRSQFLYKNLCLFSNCSQTSRVEIWACETVFEQIDSRYQSADISIH